MVASAEAAARIAGTTPEAFGPASASTSSNATNVTAPKPARTAAGIYVGFNYALALQVICSYGLRPLPLK